MAGSLIAKLRVYLASMKKAKKSLKKPTTSFAAKVLAVTARIPKGRTLTYQEVARRAGRPKAYRAVGNILNRYGGMDVGVPCHRVIRSDGTPGGYAWGTKKKAAILRKEKAI